MTNPRFILEAILASGVKLQPMPQVLFDLADMDKDVKAGLVSTRTSSAATPA